MKKWICVIVLAAMVLAMLAACDPRVITQEEAEQIAFKAAGVSQKDVTSVHTHIVNENGVLGYNVHFTAKGTDYGYLISSTGEVLETGTTH